MIRIGYYTAWSTYRGDKADLETIVQGYTHIIYAFVITDDKGNVSFSDEWAAIGKGDLAQLEELRSRYGFQLGISIGGWNNREALLKADPDRLAQNMAQFRIEQGFDFVDIDWEFDSAQQASQHKQKVHKFIQNLHCLLGADSFLTMAIHCNIEILEALDLTCLAVSVRYFILMGYDLSGSWSKVAGGYSHLKGQGSVSVVLEHLQRRVAPGMITVGVSGFGVKFEGCQGRGHSFKSCSVFPMRSLKKSLEHHWDESTASSQYIGHKEFISIESAKSLRVKEKYIISHAFAGLAVWDIEEFSHMPDIAILNLEHLQVPEG